jgi:hypothetical protein
MFAGSSQGPRTEGDGSHAVYCEQCREFIGLTFERVARALCAICDAAQTGRPLTEQAIREYRLSKAPRVDISALALEEQPITTVKRKRTLVGIGGEIMEAIGRFARTTPETPPPSTLPSVQVARGKKRPRLFEGVVLGSMAEVDKKAGKP